MVAAGRCRQLMHPTTAQLQAVAALRLQSGFLLPVS